jgi:plasmid stabilization system protein ParE
MTRYKVRYRQSFYEDVAEIHDYISRQLKNDFAARNTVDKIRESVENLRFFPAGRKVFCDDEATKYFAKTSGNFQIFYVISGRSVEVLKVQYSKRDIRRVLSSLGGSGADE